MHTVLVSASAQRDQHEQWWFLPPGPAEMLLYCSPLASKYFMNGVGKMNVSDMAARNWEDWWWWWWCVFVCTCMHMCVYVTWEIGTQNLKVTRSNNLSYCFQLSLCLFN